MNTTFSRLLLKGALEEVRKLIPAKQSKEAWVWTSDRRTWEFHFQEYFQCFGASDAYEAKAKGWRLWLARHEERTRAERTIEKAIMEDCCAFSTGPWDCHNLGVCIVTYESKPVRNKDAGYVTQGEAQFYFEWFDKALKLMDAEAQVLLSGCMRQEVA
jgi:hypothetical protein